MTVTFTKWAQDRGDGKTGFYVGGFLDSAGKLFDRAEGTRRQKVARFKAFCLETLRLLQLGNPVDTGHSRAAWTITFDDDGVRVRCALRNPAGYVVYLEYGTYKMAPRTWIRPTLASQRLKLREGGL